MPWMRYITDLLTRCENSHSVIIDLSQSNFFPWKYFHTFQQCVTTFDQLDHEAQRPLFLLKLFSSKINPFATITKHTCRQWYVTANDAQWFLSHRKTCAENHQSTAHYGEELHSIMVKNCSHHFTDNFNWHRPHSCVLWRERRNE